MIYLFDNTPDSYINQRIDIAKYSDVITIFSSIDDKLVNEFANIIVSAECDCVMVHRSYNAIGQAGKIILSAIRTLASSESTVPVIVFSDGDGSTEFKNDHVIKAMKKDKFYSNLSLFLDNFINKGKFDLILLDNGEKADAYQAVKYGQEVLSRIMLQKDSDCLVPEDIDCDSFFYLVGQSQPALGKTYSSIMVDLMKSDMMVGSFRNRIKSIINSFCYYGKNIYSWK